MRYPVVTITMEDGSVMKLEPCPEVTSGMVNNFLSLTKKRFYDGLIFHRAIEGFMTQGGCPIGNGEGSPGYVIKGKLKQNGVQNNLKHERGVISMAHTSIPDFASNQFFIIHKAAPRLDGSYAVFGGLIEGEDALDRIATTKTNTADKPLKDQKIETVTVEISGETYPEPEKLPGIEY